MFYHPGISGIVFLVIFAATLTAAVMAIRFVRHIDLRIALARATAIPAAFLTATPMTLAL